MLRKPSAECPAGAFLKPWIDAQSENPNSDQKRQILTKIEHQQQQEIVRSAAQEAGVFQRKVALQKSEECLAQLKKSKTEVTEISAAENARFREAVKPVVDKYSKQYNEALAKEMFDQIAKIRGGK